MIHTIILGLSALIGSLSQGNYYIEQEITLHKGWNKIQTEAPWTSVSLFSKNRKTALPDMWIAKNGEAYSWSTADDENPADFLEEKSNDWVLEPSTFQELQTKLFVKSEEKVDVMAHFYNPLKPLEALLANIGMSDQGDLNLGEFIFGDDLLEGVNVTDFKNETEIGSFSGSFQPRFITRQGWGADETMREWSPSKGLFSFFRKIPPEAKYIAKKFHPIVVTKKNENGKRLTWPVEKNPKIFKIILHHTGEYFDDRHQMRQNPKAHIRSIYAYHTITRKWGDIGYNFIIDKKGDIYEGRAGGSETVGAHAAYYNIGTQGISLIGNFNVEQPTQEQIKTLSIFLSYLTDKYNIDPLGKSNHLKIDSYNITGHRFVARKGNGTSCPGENIVRILPALRKKVSEVQILLKKLQKAGKRTGLDFLQKSEMVQRHLKKHVFKLPKKEAPLSMKLLLEKYLLQRGVSKTIEISIKNTSNKDWEQGVEMEAKNIPSGMIASKFRATKKIPKGFSGIFRGKIEAKTVPNGEYYIQLWPSFLENFYSENQLGKNRIEFPIQVSGSTMFSFSNYPLQANTIIKKSSSKNIFQSKRTSIARPKEPEVKIKIAGFSYRFIELINTKKTELWSKNTKVASIPAKTIIKASLERESNKLKIILPDKQFFIDALFLKNPEKGIFTINNYQNPRFGKGQRKYNTFLGHFDLYPEAEKNEILVVNRLKIETYLAGLAEEPSTEPEEKKHAIHILARSYAYVYSGSKRKFKTNRYDLEDDPRTSQLYLGYEWTKYHSDQKNLLKKTRGKTITYNKKAVIGPYFTQSGGESSSAWQKQYPWTRAQKLPFDEGLNPKGHGVGLSGNSARELAKQGRSYSEILSYFFDGIEIQKQY